MDIQEKLKLIQEVGEEVIGLEEIEAKLKAGQELIAYDGFEPSGKIHIAQGLLRAINIQKLLQAGIKFKLLVADWHAYANNKLGGDMAKIEKTGQYFIEVWKACGLDVSQVEIIRSSDLVKDSNYWLLVLKIAKASTINRMIRCSQIMGRNESETLSAAQIIYPCMQTADIFSLNVDIAQLGMDQRKVNMLARQIADELGLKKPAAVHHHMLISLQPPIDKLNSTDSKEDRTIALKMSKSNPTSAIFMTDTKEEIYDKIKKAYCPPNDILINPVLEYFKYIVFAKYPQVKINREAKFGGNLTFDSYDKLESAYQKGEIYPLDLKDNLSRYLDELISPVRDYFNNNPEAKKLKEEVESFTITR
ncbi:MAG: tyrosine--tRNA ligase [Candidatus Shapirobacteria bacterium]|nr:tyrosine--tRNA ligase [Candidatus Shapirobacteria bacterium]MDD4410157.1 tyrosine--tRNA ligase [Candidatus Shapirobacteria bacterium]